MDSPDEFDRFWPGLEAAINQDLGGAVYTREEIWADIACGGSHLWTTENAACIAEVIERPQGSILNLFALYVNRGHVSEFLQIMFPEIEQWARNNGFKTITGSGRDVWVRLMKRHGVKPVLTTFAKEL